MPMDGVMLGFAARELSKRLVGGRVDKVAQPEKDELIFSIRNIGENVQLLVTANADSARAHLTRVKKNNPMEPPVFCMLLRKRVIGARISRIEQIGGDRVLEIGFETVDELGDSVERTLVCEFMGRHSNLIFVTNGRVLDSARHVTAEISRVREVLPGLPYERPLIDKLPYDALSADALSSLLAPERGSAAKALAAHVSGLSAPTAREIALRIAGDEDARVESLNVSAFSERAAEFLRDMPSLCAPRVVLGPDGMPMDVLPFPYLTRAGLDEVCYDTVSEALEAYHAARDRVERVRQKASSLHKVLKNNIERCEKKLGLQLAALQDGARMEEYRLKGELLTASPHLAQKGAKAVELPNYYDPDCKAMLVELDAKLSARENAQRYFKLYRKAQSARVLAEEQRVKTEEELSYLEGQMENLSKCEEEPELYEIREELERMGYVRANHNRRQMKSLPPSKPMRFTASDGHVILVGKNNLQNDKLTLGAQPDEWWLHAKDMPGSHVIVVGEDADENVLEQAASLAAYYSKGRASGSVPVDATRRRYVKKPSGAKPGFVIYTHQRTINARPLETLAGAKGEGERA